jgi:hypothetical protein
MGTRSAIAVAHGDVIKAVYCHWDGYLEHNGRILQKHYPSHLANQLVAMGDISSLRPEIGEKHAFSRMDTLNEAGITMSAEDYETAYGNMTTFYARDRGEDPADWSVFNSREDFVSEMGHRGCEYLYLMDGGVWYVSTGDEFQRLETALESIKENENA